MEQVRKQRRNASQWGKLLQQWSKSGESAERFATRIGVKPATLARWRKAAGGEPREDGGALREKKAAGRAESRFARVQVVEPPSRANGLIEVVLRDGLMLRLHGVVDADTLGAVLGCISRC